MAEETATPKPKTKRKSAAPIKFVVRTKTGIINIVENEIELAALFKAQPGSEAWALGRKVRGILCFPGKHNLVTDVREKDKVVLAFDK